MERKIVDLTKEISGGMDVYPGDPEVEITVVQKIEDVGWELRNLSMGSHTGTHVDAFSHMSQNAENLSQISLEHFIGTAIVAISDHDFPANVGLIFRSGIITPNMVKGIIKAKTSFVATDDACELEVEEERELLSNGIVTITNLVNTDKLPINQEFLFLALPLKIKDGDGSPTRAIAILNGE